MSPWLHSTSELVKLRSLSEMFTLLVNVVTKNLNISETLLLCLSEDGRQLQYQELDQDFSWSILDFDVPFSHVLQEKKPRCLGYSELVYWQDNQDFKRLTSRVKVGQTCLIYPLASDYNLKPSLLVLIGETESLRVNDLSDDFLKFLEIFCLHCLLIQDLKLINSDKRELSETVSAERKINQQHQKILEISSQLIGDSPVMFELKKKIVQIAESTLSVMIQGETGTGKEVVANVVHSISKYNKGQFVALNCSAIPENLLESELFGYEKGAFSGADSSHMGLIKQADGGTLFLDEIGDMPLNLQAKLLRVLETKAFRPLGGKAEVHSNFRLISATHIKLKEKVKEKKFRQDLYYRLMQCPLYVPSLAERESDIEQLSAFFIDNYNRQNDRNVGSLTKQAADYLKTLDFNGNVRELKSMIELSCSQVEDEHLISLACISQNSDILDLHFDSECNSNDHEITFSINNICDLKKGLENFERKIIKSRVEQFSGNKTKAAKSLGIPVRTLTYKYKKMES